MGADPQLCDLMDEYERLASTWKKRGARFEEVEAFQQRIIDVYEQRAPIQPRDGKIRVSFNFRQFRGWATVAASTATVTNQIAERADEAYPGDGHAWKYMRRYFVGALLYADQVVDQDPLSFERYFRGDPASALYRLGDAFHELKRVRPLIESGILLMAPLPPGQNPGEDPEEQVRVGAERWAGETQTLRGPHSAGDVMWRWYFRDALATARSADATLVPRDESEQRYLEFLASSVPNVPSRSAPVRIITSLSAVDLPMFAGVPADLLVKIHRNEEAFADWRVTLRSAARLINAETTEQGFAEEAKEIYDDTLQPAARAVRRATSRSLALKSIAKEQPLRLVLGAGFGLVIASSMGLPPLGSVASSVAGALANISYASLSPGKVSGASAIVSMLDRHR